MPLSLARDGQDARLLAQTLKEQHALLERLTLELQRSVVAIRVLPLRHVFQRFARLVREMTAGLGNRRAWSWRVKTPRRTRRWWKRCSNPCCT